MLPGLHREGGRHTRHTRLKAGGRCAETPLTFTVSLGIFLLEASFRGQSSSGGKG